MEKILKAWKNSNIFGKCAYLSLCLLFFMIPFTGLILELLNISIINIEFIYGIYVISIIFSVLAKKWKLVLIEFI